MLSILETEPSLPPRAVTAPAEPPAENPAATPEIPPKSAEFEIVLGRANVASWLFIAVIAMAVCSSLAYLAGRSAGPRKAMAAAASAAAPVRALAVVPTVESSPAALPTSPAAQPTTASPAAALPIATSPAALPTSTFPHAAQPTTASPVAALPTASILAPPNTAARTGAPLFAEPEAGQVYIQIGAVEKGMATILAEGLRSHGFDAFVAAGPSERVFRVLIGPLPNPESFRRAKAAVDAIDLSAFARRYEK